MAKKLNIKLILAAQMAKGINPEDEKIRIKQKIENEEERLRQLRFESLKRSITYQAGLIEHRDDSQDIINTMVKDKRKLFLKEYKGFSIPNSYMSYSQWKVEHATISHPMSYLRNVRLHKGIEYLGNKEEILQDIRSRIDTYNMYHPTDKFNNRIFDDIRHILKNLAEYIPDIMGDSELIFEFKARHVTPKNRHNPFIPLNN